MTTLVTGAGLVGTAYAKEAAKRGEKVVFGPDPSRRLSREAAWGVGLGADHGRCP